MKIILFLMALSWILGAKSKIYYCLATLPTIIWLANVWPVAIIAGIINFILIPRIVAKAKTIAQPKIDRLLDDVHTLAEEARKKEP